MTKSKIKWLLKQLLPLAYESQYLIVDPDDPDRNRIKETCKWRMWFGRCFNERYFAGWV